MFEQTINAHNMFKINLKSLAFLSLILLMACKKDDEGITQNEESETELNISIENTDVKTFEVLSLTSSLSSLRTAYSGKLGETEVTLANLTPA
ncbi:hypothetical protein [Algibacter sp. L1A34]|uniref:hypothetical protein n=1 Tax=Algibacter sp. L1A34 TaxID=2686365 RepID=UPI00131DB266|nr:hypothetical protein [Algibacter sp. L1A34]